MIVYTYEEIKVSTGILSGLKTRECVNVYCVNCNKTLQQSKKKLLRSFLEKKIGVFCDNKCFMLYKNKDKVSYLKCETCYKEVRRTPSMISGKTFCSRSCAAKTNNIGKRRHPPRTCKKCLKEYLTSKDHRSLRICQDCKSTIFTTDQAKQMSISDYTSRESLKNKHPSWKYNHVRNFNRSWNKDLVNTPCQVCKYSTHTELAHIKAISSFPDDTKLCVVNDPSNILVLCPTHHWEFDNDILKLEDIPAR